MQVIPFFLLVLSLLFLTVETSFKAILGSRQNWGESVQTCHPCPYSRTASPSWSASPWGKGCGEAGWTYPDMSLSTRVHGVCSVGLDSCIMTCVRHCGTQSNVSALQVISLTFPLFGNVLLDAQSCTILSSSGVSLLIFILLLVLECLLSFLVAL